MSFELIPNVSLVCSGSAACLKLWLLFFGWFVGWWVGLGLLASDLLHFKCAFMV